MTKDKYHHGTLKLEMIEKGLQLLNREGYDGFSLRKVAQLCNVSHAAPYKHFKSKEELILAISQQVITSFRASLQEAADQNPASPKKRVVEMGKSYVRFMVNNPEYMRFLFLSENKHPVVIKKNTLYCDEHSPFALFKRCAEDYLSSIKAEPGEWVDDILTLWSFVHGLSVLVINQSIHYDKDYLEIIDRMMEKRLAF